MREGNHSVVVGLRDELANKAHREVSARSTTFTIGKEMHAPLRALLQQVRSHRGRGCVEPDCMSQGAALLPVPLFAA